MPSFYVVAARDFLAEGWCQVNKGQSLASFNTKGGALSEIYRLVRNGYNREDLRVASLAELTA